MQKVKAYDCSYSLVPAAFATMPHWHSDLLRSVCWVDLPERTTYAWCLGKLDQRAGQLRQSKQIPGQGAEAWVTEWGQLPIADVLVIYRLSHMPSMSHLHTI